ncbi:uncharacterized protein [Palaemon carinicauda]|uniref:uncharacterized protein isoform X2 n=1 Tax=Palaemon carinicauda TaxID=392227 RepID=UPI0035B612AF
MNADPGVSEQSKSEPISKKIKTEGLKSADCIQKEEEEYFMAVAFLSSMRSKDPRSKVGACIVDEKKKVVGVGYNGMPSGIKDYQLPWSKKAKHPLETKKMYVCHAEMNAIMNTNGTDLAGCTIYVVLFPCAVCTRLIIQAGIKKVIFYSDKYGHKPKTAPSKLMLEMAKVSYREYKSDAKRKITVDFMMNNGPNTEGSSTGERDYLAWQKYFMALAKLSALQSKDSPTQVGACIVSKANKIVGLGYKGMPGRWDVENRHDMFAHAVENAVMNKNCGDVHGCTIYVTLFPCNECAKIIIQAGITEVIYLSGGDGQSDAVRASKKMLGLAGIPYR